jgi:hypothetical protein
MAVETATERAIFFEADDFAVTASYTPSGGVAANVNGIFDNEHVEVDAGGSVTVSLQQPLFTCQTSDVSSAAEGDAITISGTDYTVRDVRPDGTGVTVLVLEED